MARLEAALVDMEALKEMVEKVNLENADLKQELAALKQDVAAMKPDLDAVKTDVADLKPDVSTVKTDVASMKPEISTVKVDVAAVRDDVDVARTNITALQDDVAKLKTEVVGVRNDVGTVTAKNAAVTADVAGLKTDKAGLRTDLDDLATLAANHTDRLTALRAAVVPDMSWCPDGAKRVPTDVRFYGSRSGFGVGGAISSGVYCIENSMDLRMGRFSILKDNTVELIGKPGLTPLQLKFGGFTVVHTAKLKITDLSLQIPERNLLTERMCMIDSEWLEEASSGAVGGTTYQKKACKENKAAQAKVDCCNSNSGYEAYRGFPAGVGDEAESIAVYGGLFEMIRGDISHSNVHKAVVNIDGGGKATFTNTSFFDNHALQYAVFEMYSQPSLNKPSELELHGCHIFGDNSGGSSNRNQAPHGLARVRGNSKVTVRSSQFEDLVGSDAGAFHAETSTTIDIDSASKFMRCFVPTGATRSQPS